MKNRKTALIHLTKLILYANLGVLLFVSKILLEWAMNIHLVGVLLVAFTVAFRKEALIPLYVFVFLNGLYAGFNPWWFAYLYIWLPLWALTMLLPKNIKPRNAGIAYMLICGAHGLLFGILYSPVWVFIYKFNFTQLIVWIVNGFPADILHCVSNVILGTLIYPLSKFLQRINNKYLKI